MSEVRQLRQPQDFSTEITAEQQLLGAILLDPATLDRVSDILQPEHFLDPVHARIFSICSSRISKGHLASAAAMAGIMSDDEGLKPLGGGTYLIRLAGNAVSVSMARDYAMLMVEYACRRKLRLLAEDAGQSLSAGVDAAEVRAALQQGLYALPEASGAESSVSILKAMTNAVDQAAHAYQGNTSFLKTGVPALDQVLKGLAPGDVLLLGGATSMGKTSLALEIAANVALRAEKPGKVGFWSLEMTGEQLATRMASAVSSVPYSALRDAATMEEADFRKWIMGSQKVGEAGLRIVPRHIRDLAAGHAALRRIKREFNGQLDLAIIDYAQLVRGQGKSRFEQMTEVSIGIKALAGLLECPVIALVQLSRDIGFRDDKRPQLSDIKETGQFENDADQVVFCHREGYWLQRQGPKAGKDGSVSTEAMADFEAEVARNKNLLELIVRKNRHGALATAQVGFHEATNRFWSLGHRDIQEGFE
jgi:replicative DNA helicase